MGGGGEREGKRYAKLFVNEASGLISTVDVLPNCSSHSHINPSSTLKPSLRQLSLWLLELSSSPSDRCQDSFLYILRSLSCVRVEQMSVPLNVETTHRQCPLLAPRGAVYVESICVLSLESTK